MTLAYTLTGDWTQDPSLIPVRQNVFDDHLLVLTIDSNQSGSRRADLQRRAPDRRLSPRDAATDAADDQ